MTLRCVVGLACLLGAATAPRCASAQDAACPTKYSATVAGALELPAECGPVAWDGWLLARPVYARLRGDLAGETVRADEAEAELLIAWVSVAGALALGLLIGSTVGAP